MVIFLTWLKSIDLDNKESFSRCFNCGKRINIHYTKGIQIHVNINQNPEKKYFCSKTCKNAFSVLK